MSGTFQIYGTVSDATLGTSGSGVYQGILSYYNADSGFAYSWQFSSASVLADVTLDQAVSYTALWGNVTVLRGTIDNGGTLATQSGYTWATTLTPMAQLIVDGQVTLDGAGQVVLANGGLASSADFGYGLHQSTDPDQLVNVANTISGYGYVSVDIVNQAGGMIDANVAGQQLSLAGSIVNRGIIEAEDGGSIVLTGDVDGGSGAFTGSVVNALNGLITLTGTVTDELIAVSSGGTVQVGQSGAIASAQLSGDGSGVYQGILSYYNADSGFAYSWQFSSASVLADVTLDQAVSYTALWGNVTVLRGTIDNGGTLATQSGYTWASTLTPMAQLIVDGRVTLDGAGQVVLANGGLASSADFGYGLHQSTDPDQLVNVANTISGYGYVSVDIVNQAGGMIDANVAGQQIYLSAAVTNQGLIGASNGGNLYLNSSALFNNAGGTVEATGTDSVVDLGYTGFDHGTVLAANGGTVNLDNGGTLASVVLASEGAGIFQGTTSSPGYGSALQDVTIGSGVTYTALSGNTTTLRGTIVNDGLLAATNGQLVIDGTVTLSGGGLVTLGVGYVNSAVRADLANQSTVVAELINVNNTITGYGYFADASLTVVNQANGVIDANISGQQLGLDVRGSNQGLIEASSGGNLYVTPTGAFDNTGGTIQAVSTGVVDLLSVAYSNGAVIADTGGTVDLDNGGTLISVVLASDGTGVFQGTTSYPAYGTSGYPIGVGGSALQDVTIGSGVTYTALSGNTTTLRGTIVNDGLLAATNGQLVIDGTVTLSGGGLVTLGVGYVNSAVRADLANQSTVAAELINVNNTITGYGYFADASLTMVNQANGVIDANISGQQLGLDVRGSNQGLIEASSGGNLYVTPTGAFDNTGGTVEALSGGLVEVGSDSHINAGTVFAGLGGTVALDAGGSWLDATLTLARGGTIDLRGVNPQSVAFGEGELDYTDPYGQSASFSLCLTGGSTGIQIGSDGTNGTAVTALCFCAGTFICTPNGERPVERLSIGDLVLTHSGQAHPITWIGIGHVLATRGRRNAATPVIVCKGALADNVPHRDLHVTKGHSLFVDHMLIPVEFLVNHRSILWDDRAQEVDIYHIELARHDVLIANGAPAESYRDDGNRWLFQNANSGWGLPPQEPCAPVLTGGPIVDTVWRQLLERARGPSRPLTTDDPDLHIMADGKRVEGHRLPDGIYSFRLPTVPRNARVVSRSSVPSELGLARDFRELGVAVRRIALWRAAQVRLVEADDPSLHEGFHLFEEDNGFRWTDGNAAIPAGLYAGLSGPCEIELHVACTTQYPIFGEELIGEAG